MLGDCQGHQKNGWPDRLKAQQSIISSTATTAIVMQLAANSGGSLSSHSENSSRHAVHPWHRAGAWHPTTLPTGPNAVQQLTMWPTGPATAIAVHCRSTALGPQQLSYKVCIYCCTGGSQNLRLSQSHSSICTAAALGSKHSSCKVCVYCRAQGSQASPTPLPHHQFVQIAAVQQKIVLHTLQGHCRSMAHAGCVACKHWT